MLGEVLVGRPAGPFRRAGGRWCLGRETNSITATYDVGSCRMSAMRQPVGVEVMLGVRSLILVPPGALPVRASISLVFIAPSLMDRTGGFASRTTRGHADLAQDALPVWPSAGAAIAGWSSSDVAPLVSVGAGSPDPATCRR
jgi:hypothetical protein